MKKTFFFCLCTNTRQTACICINSKTMDIPELPQDIWRTIYLLSVSAHLEDTRQYHCDCLASRSSKVRDGMREMNNRLKQNIGARRVKGGDREFPYWCARFRGRARRECLRWNNHQPAWEAVRKTRDDAHGGVLMGGHHECSCRGYLTSPSVPCLGVCVLHE